MKTGWRLLWPAALLAVTGCNDRPAEAVRLDAPAGGETVMRSLDQIGVENGRGLYTATRGDQVVRIPFDLPLDRVDPLYLHLGDKLGETDEGLVVMLDEYGTRQQPSRPDCVKGGEGFVRIFSLPLRRELRAIPVESCLDRLAAPTPRATWLGAGQFRVETPPKRVYALSGPDGIDELEAR